MYHMVFNLILIVDIQKKIAKYQRFKEGVNVITSNDNHVAVIYMKMIFSIWF